MSEFKMPPTEPNSPRPNRAPGHSQHPFFRDAQAPKGPSIVPRMREIEAEDSTALETKEVSKGEVYALVGVLMKQVMAQVNVVLADEEACAANAQKVIQDLCALLEYEEGRFVVPDTSVVYDAQKKMVQENIWCLRHLLSYFVTDILNGDIGSLGGEGWKAFNRLDTVTKKHKKEWGRDYALEYQNGFKLILSGLGTAGTETWLLMNTLPQLFYRAFGRNMTEEEFDDLMKDGGDILINIASLSVHTLYPLQKQMKGAQNYQDKIKAGLERYEIRMDEAGRPELCFQEEYLSRAVLLLHFKNMVQPQVVEPHHGCPVRDIRVPDSQGKLVSGIQAVVDFYRPLAKQVILPYQEALRDTNK